MADSGHGGQTKDKDGDEIDGFDEVVFPLDYKTAGHLVDDDMHALMVHPLPTGCRLTALFDVRTLLLSPSPILAHSLTRPRRSAVVPLRLGPRPPLRLPLRRPPEGRAGALQVPRGARLARGRRQLERLQGLADERGHVRGRRRGGRDELRVHAQHE
jgi:hypothetical protein